MTEITKIQEKSPKPRHSVNPTAFFCALIGAPLVVTALSFWTVIGLFALPFGIIPYLVIGTPTLLWAVGRLKPRFSDYALLGFSANLTVGLFLFMFLNAHPRFHTEAQTVGFIMGFGLIFAPLYAGAFGSLYASLHPNIRILQT